MFTGDLKARPQLTILLNDKRLYTFTVYCTMAQYIVLGNEQPVTRSLLHLPSAQIKQQYTN